MVDRSRLCESGVAAAFAPATVDFASLPAATPCRAEKLVDRVAQATPPARGFPDGLDRLRQNGLRTVLDLLRSDGQRGEDPTGDTGLTGNGITTGTARAAARSVAHLYR